MTIENIKVGDIKLYEKNARKHPKKQIDLLIKNIKRFGFTTPLLIDKNNELIAGHGRIMAGNQIGMIEYPCVRLENLTADEVKALRLADNQIASLAEWDLDLALPELKGLDIELQELVGFDLLNIDQLGESFVLPDGEKAPFQQITFTLADKQAEAIEDAIREAKQLEDYNYIETFKNENSNGNALYLIIMQWLQQRT